MLRIGTMASVLAALFAVLGGRLAGAEPLTLRYTATWAGLPAGEIHLQFAEGTSDFRSQIDIRTEGLPRWFTRFRARGISEGTLQANGLAAPVRYDATYDLRSRRDKRISMRFERAGNDVVAERGAEDSREKWLLPPAPSTDAL